MNQHYYAVTSESDLRDLAELIRSTPDKPVGFDIETGYHGPPQERGSLDPDFGFVAGFSITTHPSWAAYVPIRHDEGPNLDPALAWRFFRPILEGQLIVPHNAPFEIRHMQREGIDLNAHSDTLVEAYCMGKFPEYGLKYLTKKCYGHDQKELVDLYAEVLEEKKTAKLKKTGRFNVLPPTDPRVVAYACEDSAWTLKLHGDHWPQVHDMEIYQIEMEIVSIVVDMANRGVCIDFEGMRKKEEEWAEFTEEFREDIINELRERLNDHELTINLNSPKQVREVFYERLKDDKGKLIGSYVRKKSPKTGEKSTDEKTMKALAKHDATIAKFVEYRKLNKLSGSYLRKWPRDFSWHPDGKAHPGWKQAGVPAGRFAVADPPVQQCPKDFHYATKSGREFSGNFRGFIVPSRGHYFLDFDYGQIEPRAMAGLAGEKDMIEAFDQGYDPYVFTASRVFNKPLDEVTAKERSMCKPLVLALNYDMKEKSLAEMLGVSMGRAKLLMRKHQESIPKIITWKDEMRFRGKANGYVHTYWGRRVPIFEFQSENKWVRLEGERLSVNAPVQGFAADYMKKAMIRAKEALTSANLWYNGVYLVINNHDELLFEVRDDIPAQEVINILEPAVSFPVEGFPIFTVDWATGHSWGSVQEVKDD